MNAPSGLALVALAAAFLGCESKVVPIALNIVTTACQPPSPMDGVTHFRVRVRGEGIDPPREALTVVDLQDRRLAVPEIPAGRNRVIEVRAYAGDPRSGAKVVSLGQTVRFDVPDLVSAQAAPIELAVFLRRVNAFTPPNTVIALNSCGRMLTPRAGHSATVLSDGRVFIAGGYQLAGGARVALADAELYNPSTGGFEEVPKIGIVSTNQVRQLLPRAFHSATLLSNNQVLVWGGEEYGVGDVNGSNPTPRASVLVYDPNEQAYGGVSQPRVDGGAPTPIVARARHQAARDSSGKVLVVGGLTRPPGAAPTVVDVVEWYDPARAQVKRVDGVKLPRRDMNMLPLQEGRFLAVAGGSDGVELKAEVTVFKLENDAFVPHFTSPLRLREPRRAAGAATLRGTSDLFLLGGYTDATETRPVASSEIISSQESFSVTDGPAVIARGQICAVSLPDGRVLSLGGRNVDGPSTPPYSDPTVELFVPQGNAPPVTLRKEELKTPRHDHTCTALEDGSVLVLGGVREANAAFEVLQDAQIFTPEPLEQ